MSLSLSHFEIEVRDLPAMVDFYTRILGFAVTDRSAPGVHQMVFLSRNPGEHHQIVLAQAGAAPGSAGSLDHIAFRVENLQSLRRFHVALRGSEARDVATVSHGTTWSIYFRDPEGNRIELFVDTPWHVAQPLRFPIDLSLPDDALIAETHAQISSLADFQPAAQWFDRHERRLSGRGPDD